MKEQNTKHTYTQNTMEQMISLKTNKVSMIKTVTRQMNKNNSNMYLNKFINFTGCFIFGELQFFKSAKYFKYIISHIKLECNKIFIHKLYKHFCYKSEK